MIKIGFDKPWQVSSWPFHKWGPIGDGWKGFRILGLVVEWHE